MPIGPIGGGGGGGGTVSAAGSFIGQAVLGAQDAKTSGLNVHLSSPIVSADEALEWDLLGRDRDDAVAAVNANTRMFTNSARTQGIEITLDGVPGAAGNGWRFVRGGAGDPPISLLIIRDDNFSDILVSGVLPATYTAAQFLAFLNADANLSAAYFGGEDGSSVPFNDVTINPFVTDAFSGGVDAIAAEALSVIVDSTAKTVTYRAEVTDTLGDVKAAFDAIDGLDTAYLGGADATTIAARPLPWDEDFTLQAGSTVIEFLAEDANFPSVGSAARNRLYVKQTGEGRIKGKASTNAVGPEADVADWVQSSYHGEGAGDASTAGAALSAEHDYYYDTTTERFREQIADGTISFVDTRDVILPDGVTLLSNGSFIAGAGRYANHQAAIDYLDESFHDGGRPQVTTFTSWVFFDVAEDDVRVITNFAQSVAAGTEDALVPLDSGAIISLALGDPGEKPDYSIWNFLGQLYRVVPDTHSGHTGSVDFTTVWTERQIVTDYWPAGTGALVYRGEHERGATVPNPHSGDIIVTPSGAWERFYIFRHEIPTGWYSHDPPEGWIGLRADEADAEAHTFRDDAVVLYGGEIHVSSNYVAPIATYITRRYDPVFSPSSVYGERIAHIQFKSNLPSITGRNYVLIEGDDVGTAGNLIGWTVDTLDPGVALGGTTNALVTQLVVPRLRPALDVTGFVVRASCYPVVGGNGSSGFGISSTTIFFDSVQPLAASVEVGDELRINEEIVRMDSIATNRRSATVTRARAGTTAVGHAAPWYAQELGWVSPYDEVDFEWGPGNVFNQSQVAESVNPVKVGPRQVISMRYKSLETSDLKYIEMRSRDGSSNRRVPPSTMIEVFYKKEG